MTIINHIQLNNWIGEGENNNESRKDFRGEERIEGEKENVKNNKKNV